MVKITKVTSSGAEGTAEFSVEEMNVESYGTVQFRITEHSGCKNVSMLDPFGGQNPHGYQTLVALLKFELGQRGLI